MYQTGIDNEVVICTLVPQYSINRLSTFSMMKNLHNLYNDSKIKDNSGSKFLIKTIKPRI